MDEKREWHHDDGRICRFENGRWWVKADLRDVIAGHVECTRDHTLDGDECENPDGRGEFGMPTLGVVAGGCVKPLLNDEPEFKMTVTRKGIELEYGDKGCNVYADTEEAQVILDKILPDLLSKFLVKNAQYARAQTGHDLGIKGIIPDINRKSAALITAVWDGQPTLDTVDELAGDLVGHLLLMLAKTRMADG